MKKLFTLIELIVVVVILGILAAIVIPNISDTKKEAIVSMMEGNIRNVQSAVDIYQLQNDGDFPTIQQPTIEKPQRVEFDLLYPKYLKSLPNEKKVPEQKYWVDVYGKVWGSTVNAPESFYESSKNIEWVSETEIVGYNFYELKTKETTSKVFDKIISLRKQIFTKGTERIQLPNTQTPFLVSSIDQYGLETAPVGPSYQGVSEDWFTPILKKEGTFYIEFGSTRTMYWDRFWTQEDKPVGTNIFYRFSVQNEDGSWTDYIDDFESLKPSKRIKIEVKMIGSGNLKPSLLDMRVDYHFMGEQIEYYKPILIPSNELPFVPQSGSTGGGGQSGEQYFYRYDIPTGNHISNISPSYGSSITQVYDSKGIEVNSLGQLSGGSDIYISTDFYAPYNPPIVGISKTPLEVKKENPNAKNIPALDYLVDIPEIKDTEWTTVDGFNLFFFAGSLEEVDWLNSVIQDKKPQHTRILYYYTPNNEAGWGEVYEDISLVPNSRAIKVAVILQVETIYLNKTEEPTFISMVINHKEGSVSSESKGKDFLMINPIKLNDTNKAGYYPTTQIKWNYVFDSTSGNKVSKAEWKVNGNKVSQPETSYSAGDYTVELRIQDTQGNWSEWIKKEITVSIPNQIPSAVITMNPNTSITTASSIQWSYTNSIDLDGDAIVKAEWKLNGILKSNPNGSLPQGSYTMQLRVQDSKGAWSNWETKSFVVYPNPNQNFVATTDVYQTWTVPMNGVYKIESWGAQGGNGGLGATTGAIGQQGAYAYGEIYLTQGSTLRFKIGKVGENGGSSGSGSYRAGGGGAGGGSTAIELNGTAILHTKGGNGGNGSKNSYNESWTSGSKIGGIGYVKGSDTQYPHSVNYLGAAGGGTNYISPMFTSSSGFTYSGSGDGKLKITFIK